jgi:2-oxoacid:acceptor oxidoreductase gamma subunit (pyruvate/2-ketoisovalerate family)
MKRLKLYGLGGQGVVTAAKILAHAVSIHEGRYAKSLPTYGHERRGAPIFADVMVDDHEILLNTFVYDPDLVLLFDISVIDKGMDIYAGADSETLLLVNAKDHNIVLMLRQRLSWKEIYSVDATRIALHVLGRNIPNSAMLGALAKTGIVALDSIQRSLKEHFGRKAGEINVKAATEAYHRTRKA